ncbi:hypothetical protein ACFL50_03245 [Candidatus Latescibacterota bacterium]
MSFLTLVLPVFCLDTCAETKPFIAPNLAKSEKRILTEYSVRDNKLLALTNNSTLTHEIILEHSLIAGSKIELLCRNDVYLWLVDNLRVSAALSRIYGKTYTVSPGKGYDYHGDDNDGLTVDFNRAYRDSVSTIYIGHGVMKLFLFSVSGSFINFLEFPNIDNKKMNAQSCMYVKVDNPVTRFLTNVVFAISDLEEGIMEKLFTLDDTVFSIVKTFMEDPHLYLLLQNPDAPLPEGISDVAVRMRNTIFMESSHQKAAELGKLIEKARLAAD